MSQKLDMIFLFPGNASSGRQWIGAHTAMCNLMAQGKTVGMMSCSGANIYAVRNRCLSTKLSEKGQNPLDGVDYDRLVWADSDIHFDADQVNRLISFDVEIVAGWYHKGSGEEISCGYRDMEHFKEEDKALLRQPLKTYRVRPLTVKSLEESDEIKANGLLDVDYTGLGLVVMKKGVMETLEYPWFISWVIEWEEKGVQMAEIITDDDGLCIQLQDKGYQVFIDPGTYVGHEKMVVL